MKNIGILVYDVSLTGGAEKVAIKLAEELEKIYNIHLISLFNEKKFASSSKYHYYNIMEERVSIPTHIFKLSKQLRKYIKENKIDVILAITAGVNTIALMAVKETNAKVVYCEHSNLENKTYGKKHEFRQYLGAKMANKIITLTERDRQNFIKTFHINPKNVIAIPNWFECSNTSEEYDASSKKIITVRKT